MILSSFKKLSSVSKLVIIMIFMYGGAFFVHYEFAKEITLNFFISVLGIFPFLFFVFILLFLSSLFVTPKWVQKNLGNRSGIRGWILTIFSSFATPVPPYLLFPLLEEYRKQKMSFSLLALFINIRSFPPAFVPVLAHYFGWAYTIVFGFYVGVFAIISSLLIGFLVKNKKEALS